MARLIDADELLGKMEHTIYAIQTNQRVAANVMKKLCRDDVENAPTVDAVPIVHSRWVEDYDRKNHWHCEACGLTVGIIRLQAKFCLNCGAKMDKEE